MIRQFRGPRWGIPQAPTTIPPPTLPTVVSPCDRLKLAQDRLDALMMGRAITEVETPQLGRVQYGGNAKIDDLRRYIEQLKAECAAYLGITTVRCKRGPISVEVDP